MPSDRVSGSSERFRLAAGKALVVSPNSTSDNFIVVLGDPVAGVSLPTTVGNGVAKTIGPFASPVELVVMATGTVDVDIVSGAIAALVLGAGNLNTTQLAGTLIGGTAATSAVAYPTTPMARSVMRLSTGLLAAHATAVVGAGGAAPSSAQYDAIRGPLERLMRSSAFAKLRVLWIPLGADGDLNAMRTALVEASGTKALINTGFVAGDYTAAGGLVGASGKKLATTYATNSAANGSYPALSATAWGFGSFAIAYNGAGSGVMAGLDTDTSAYLAFTGTNVSQMFGSAQVPHWPTALLSSVQTTGGNVEGWHGGWRRAAVAGSGSLPASAFSINGRNSGLYGTGTHAGFWAGDAMTQSEMAALSDFFIDANQALGRPVFNQNSLTVLADSIGFGVGVTTKNTLVFANGLNTCSSAGSNRYCDRLAAFLGIPTVNNCGVSGRSISAYSGQTASLVWADDTNSQGYITQVLRFPSTLNLQALGVNDSAYNTPLATFSADYFRLIGNLVAAGVRPETWCLVSPFWCQPAGSIPVNDATSQALAAVIKSVAATYGMAYADCLNGRARGQSAGNWDGTGLHGNDAMHFLMFQDIRDAITAAHQTNGVALLA